MRPPIVNSLLLAALVSAVGSAYAPGGAIRKLTVC
jgi:hypothetical protein